MRQVLDKVKNNWSKVSTANDEEKSTMEAKCLAGQNAFEANCAIQTLTLRKLNKRRMEEKKAVLCVGEEDVNRIIS